MLRSDRLPAVRPRGTPPAAEVAAGRDERGEVGELKGADWMDAYKAAHDANNDTSTTGMLRELNHRLAAVAMGLAAEECARKMADLDHTRWPLLREQLDELTKQHRALGKAVAELGRVVELTMRVGSEEAECPPTG